MSTEQEQQGRTFRIARGGAERGWVNKPYTLEQVLARARKDNRYVVDGYGRTKLRNARKLVAVDRLRKRTDIVFVENEPEQKPASTFGPRTTDG